ncbi:MAG TPA: secondary thiamine-phosphate synthase enzyme YjbQ [Streptomyces sp.]|nr:secondary thiamine-phosphate synthase enzyme YjbQ [Streptomyces sp.]
MRNLETQHLIEKLAVPRWQCTVKFRLKEACGASSVRLRPWWGALNPRGRQEGRRDLEQIHHTLVIDTAGPGFTDVTAQVAAWLRSIGARDGLLTAFIRHTSASLTIQENADPDVLRDLADALERSAPRGGRYRHGMEGPDDMPAHIKSMLTATSLGIPVTGGRMVLGTWQAIYLIEHRDKPHRREIALHYIGARN